MINFYERDHKYVSINPDGIEWLSVTSLIGKLYEPFNPKEKAPASSVRKPISKFPNKWYGLPVQEILDAWESEGIRSKELGNWYHGVREQHLYDNVETVHRPIILNGVKIAPTQVLVDGIYPEHMIYLASVGICGQSDYVKISNNKLSIRDYKTSKEIKREGYKNYLGTKKMLAPVPHLDDCDLVHYSLQLSIYAYMILRHNPGFTLDSLTIEHVKFVEESKDKYGYPIYLKDENNNFIVREIEEIQVDYLKSEVLSILNWLKEKKSKI